MDWRAEQRDTWRVILGDLGEQGRTNIAIDGALICFGCMGM